MRILLLAFLTISQAASAKDIFNCSSNYGHITVTEDESSLTIDCSRIGSTDGLNSKCYSYIYAGKADHKEDTVQFSKPMSINKDYGHGREVSIKNTPQKLKVIEKGVTANYYTKRRFELEKDKLQGYFSYGFGLIFTGGEKIRFNCTKFSE